MRSKTISSKRSSYKKGLIQTWRRKVSEGQGPQGSAQHAPGGESAQLAEQRGQELGRPFSAEATRTLGKRSKSFLEEERGQPVVRRPLNSERLADARELGRTRT